MCDIIAEPSYLSICLYITLLTDSVCFRFRGSATPGYELEGRERRYQSMYAGKTDHENPYGTNIVQYETLKVGILKHRHTTRDSFPLPVKLNLL